MGTTTSGALAVPLFLGALGYDMPYHFAPIAPGDTAMRVRIVEDGHFDRSTSTGWKWDYGPDDPRRFNKGGTNWAMAWAYGDWVDESVMAVQLFIHVANL